MKNLSLLFALFLLGSCARNAPVQNIGSEYQNLADVMVMFDPGETMVFEIKEITPDSTKHLFYSDSCSLVDQTVPFIEVGEGIAARNITSKTNSCKELTAINAYVTLSYDNGLIYLPVLLTNLKAKQNEKASFKKVRISSDPRYQGIWCLVQVQEVD